MSVGAPSVTRIQRNLLILLAGLLLVAVFVRSAPPIEEPYDLDAATPQGLLALRLWLAEMGYQVTRLDVSPEEAFTGDMSPGEMLFIFPGQRAYTEDAAHRVAAWVEAGGVLVLIGPRPQDRALSDAFGVEQAQNSVLASHIRQTQPILPDRPARRPALGAVFGLDMTDAPAALAVLEAEPATGGERRVTAAVQAVGDGLVWHLDMNHDLTNAKLRNLDEAALVPALLRHSAPGDTLLIDEYHLQPPPPEAREISGLQDWLYGTRWGLAVLLLSGLTLLYLTYQGVRLGPPLQDARLHRPREAAEYVEAMAGLYQRGNRRETVAQHIKRRLKTQLAKPLGLGADLDDAQFIHALREEQRYRSTTTAPVLTEESLGKLAGLLERLEQPGNDEALLQAAQEAEEWGRGEGVRQ